MENERNLAHIELINSIEPIDGADNIVTVKVLWWSCVIKKDEFKVGEKIVYVEVDSVMPRKPEYEFLEGRKYRVRTIKLMKQVSQGLILPLSVLPPNKNYSVGEDVTDIIGITKYLTPSEQEEMDQLNEQLKNSKNPIRRYLMKYKWFRKYFVKTKTSGTFPKWLSKTDEERINNLPKLLSEFGDYDVYVTEKVDYQSATFTGQLKTIINGIIGKILPQKYQFVVCSRNGITNDKGGLYWKIAEKYNIEQTLSKNPDISIQGEQGNTKVQGNKYGINGIRMWVFNIINHKQHYHYDFDEMKEFCDKYGMETVPLVKKCKLKELGTTVDEIIEFSKGKSLINPKIEREGVVVRCIQNGKKIFSFKAINPNFLLKHEN